jgi:hypothetical protein
MKTIYSKIIFTCFTGIIFISNAVGQNFPPNGTEAEEMKIGGPSIDYLTLEFPRGTDQECAPFKGQRRTIGGDLDKYGKAVLVIIFPIDCPYCIIAADQADAVISKYSDKLTVWYVNQRLNGEGACDDISELSNKYPFVKKADFKFIDIYMWNNAWNTSWHYPEQDSYWTRKESPSVYRIFDPKSKKVTGINYYVGSIEKEIQAAIKNNFTPTGANAALDNLSQFSMFPNPANEAVNIKLELKNTASTVISIKNTLGIEVLRKEMGNSTSFDQNINIENLDKAMYMVSVIVDGVTIANDKLVKQ